MPANIWIPFKLRSKLYIPESHRLTHWVTGWLTVEQLALCLHMNPEEDLLVLKVAGHFSMDKVDLNGIVDIIFMKDSMDMVDNLDMLDIIDMVNVQKTFG